MTIFSNLVYPDNEKRARRAYELSHDCVGSYHRLARQKEEIEAVLRELSIAYAAVAPSVDAVKGVTERLNLAPDWQAEAPYFAGTYVTRKALEYALEAAGNAWSSQAGRIGASAFARLVQLPRWFLINQFGRGFAATLLADLIVSAVAGRNEREELRRFIRELGGPRVKMALAVRLNEVLLEGLNGIAVALNIVGRTDLFREADDTQRAALVERVIQGGAANLDRRLESIQEDLVRAELKRMDTQRGSFTEEDA